MQTPNFVTLRALNDYIHQVLQTEISLQNIWVKAELSGFKISKGYAYFTLKDENNQLPAVCFSIAKTYQPKDGEQVLVRGSVDFYSIGGKTATSQKLPRSEQKYIASFVGFSPAENPQVCVTVIIEGAGSGGDYAVDCGRKNDLPASVYDRRNDCKG